MIPKDELVLKLCTDARARRATHCGHCGYCTLQDVLPPSAPEWVCASCDGIMVGVRGRVCGVCEKTVCAACFERMPSTRLGGTCKVCVAERVFTRNIETSRTITNAVSIQIAGAAAVAAAAVLYIK